MTTDAEADAGIDDDGQGDERERERVVRDRRESWHEFAAESRRWVLALVPTVRVVRNRVAALARGTSRGIGVLGRGRGGDD